MHYHSKTIAYFIWNGLKYGALGGLLFGTLIYVFGAQFLSVPLGVMNGGLTGLLAGIGVAVYNAYFLTAQTDPIRYRRKLVLGVGLLAYVLMLLSVSIIAFGVVFLVPLPQANVISVIWGTILFGVPAGIIAYLAAAYVSHRYADWYFILVTRGKYYIDREWMPVPNARRPLHIWRFFIDHSISSMRWIIVLLSGGALLLTLAHKRTVADALTDGVLASIATTIAIVTALMILACLNTFFIVTLNRVYFDEYHPDMPLVMYKNRLGWLCGLITLTYGCVVSGFIFAPITAFFAALAAREYAEYRYATPDKAKRKNDFAAPERLNADIDSEVLEHAALEKPTFDHHSQ